MVTDFAAVRTTVQAGVKTQGEIHENVCLSPEAKETYKQELIKALKDPQWQEEQKKIGMEYAKKFSWDYIVESWDKSFREETKNEQTELSSP